MGVEHATRLHRQLATMIALEQSIDLRSSDLLDGAVEHERCIHVIERIRRESRARRAALAARLEAIAPGTPAPDPVTGGSTLEVLSQTDRYPASSALLAAHALLTQAVMGYGILLELAFRAADSIEHLGPENTGDLVWEHLQACASSVQEVARAMPFVVVDELEDEGSSCRCNCYTCGLGICGCPLAFRRRLDLASSEAGPTEAWPGIPMVRPRPGTPAAEAGLEKGDVVTAIDGRPIESLPMFRESIEAHAPGEAFELEVRRAHGGTETVTIVRP